MLMIVKSAYPIPHSDGKRTRRFLKDDVERKDINFVPRILSKRS